MAAMGELATPIGEPAVSVRPMRRRTSEDYRIGT